MRILISGRECSSELAASIRADADRWKSDPRCAFLPAELSALSLRDARSETEYQDRLLRLVRAKSGTDTRTFDMPRRPGISGRLWGAVRVFLWKLLRYQHDRTTFRQNLVNQGLAAALEFEAAERRRLERRVEDLERRLGGR
jgi:hypothetical protein